MEHKETKPTASKKEAIFKSVNDQLAVTIMGEIVATSMAIGAVYVTDLLLPKQTEAFVARLATYMAKWRGVNAESQKLYAKKIVDVTVMNMAGLAGMGTQVAVRRAHQSEEEKTPLWYEIGRLAAGRIFGTFTSVQALTTMEKKFPSTLRSAESIISKRIGANVATDRFSELLVSNVVQAAGATVGHAPAQLLYDYLIHPPKKMVAPETTR
jgi:hypothetical protein